MNEIILDVKTVCQLNDVKFEIEKLKIEVQSTILWHREVRVTQRDNRIECIPSSPEAKDYFQATFGLTSPILSLDASDPAITMLRLKYPTDFNRMTKVKEIL